MARKNIREFVKNGNQYATILDVYLSGHGDSDGEKIVQFMDGFSRWLTGQPYHMYQNRCDAMASYMQGIPDTIDAPVWDEDIQKQFEEWGIPQAKVDRFHSVLACRILQIADHFNIHYATCKTKDGKWKMFRIM